MWKRQWRQYDRQRMRDSLEDNNDDIWYQKHRKIHQQPINNPVHEIKKLLVYYPKRFKSLEALTCEIQRQLSVWSSNGKITKRLYKQIRRYKPYLLKFQLINLSERSTTSWIVFKNAKCLSISQNKSVLHAKIPIKALKLNNKLENLELRGSVINIKEISKSMRYVKTLKSISIDGLSCKSISELKRFYLGSRASLENVTLTGNIKCKFEYQDLFRTIAEIPNLKRFIFSPLNLNDFDIKRIPFNIFKKRNVCFQIIGICSQGPLSLTTPNELGLSDLKFLAINLKTKYLPNESKYDIFQHQFLKTLEKSKKALLLSLQNWKQQDLSSLFQTCQNIITLNLTFSISNFGQRHIDFTSLKNMINLKNVFVRLDNIAPCFPSVELLRIDLFESLTSCAKTLQSVAFHMHGIIFSEDDPTVLDFFKACANTLTHFTLIIEKNTKVFHKGLTFLKQLRSLRLSYDGPTLARVIQHLSFKRLELDFTSSRNIETLDLDFRKLNLKDTFFKQLSRKNFPRIKELQLEFQWDEIKMWDKLMKILTNLPTLEKVKMKTTYQKSISYMPLIEDVKNLIRNHPTLKYIAFSLRKRGYLWTIVKRFVKSTDIAEEYLRRNREEFAFRPQQDIIYV